MYWIAHTLLTYAAGLSRDELDRAYHDPSRCCVMDFCNLKDDVKFAMIAGNLCMECRGKFQQYGVPAEALDAIEEILRWVRGEAIGKPLVMIPNSAFIIIQYTPREDEVYEKAIKLALEEIGIKVIRADQVTHETSQIFEKVRENVERCQYIIGKVNPLSLNIYFELGLAVGLKKRTLVIIEEQDRPNLPSDLNNWDCLPFTRDKLPELKIKIKEFFKNNYNFS